MCTYIGRDQGSNPHNEPVHKSTVVGRFAPTPSGKLHLGNVFSFLIAYLVARQAGGSVLMRIEDLDPARSKQSYADGVFRCLDALGFEWIMTLFTKVLEPKLISKLIKSLIVRGFCIPAFVLAQICILPNAPHFGEEVLYQGTCRTHYQRLSKEEKIKTTKSSHSHRCTYRTTCLQRSISRTSVVQPSGILR